MKLYMYYLNNLNNLYAWTVNKEYSSEFEKVRNMDLFVKKVIDIDDNDKEFRLFSADNADFMLIEDNVNDECKDYKIIITMDECNELDTLIENIDHLLISIYENIKRLKSIDAFLKNKYLNSILEVTNIYNYMEGNNILNTFDIYYDIIRNTVIEKREDK